MPAGSQYQGPTRPTGDAQAGGRIQHRGGHVPGGVGHHVVLVALLDEGRLGTGQPPVVRRAGLAHADAGGCWVGDLAPGVDDGEADVAVVQQHVGARGRADVGDRVRDPQARAAEVRLDPAAQQQLLAEDRGLENLGLRPEHALVAGPRGAVSGQPGRQPGITAVQAVGLGPAVRVVEDRRVVGAAELHRVQPAGGHQPAGEAAEPADPGGLVVPGAGQAHRRPPGERPAAEPRPADVEAPVDQHLEVEAGPGAEAQQPDPALSAVRGLHQLDAGELLEPADPRQQLAPGPLAPPQIHHALRLRPPAMSERS